MHVITYTRSTHVLYEQQVSLQFSTKYTTLLITLTECTQRSRDRDPTLHQACGSKVGMSTDKFNQWLKNPYLNTSPPRGNQSTDWDYTSLVLFFIPRAPGRSHLRDRWVH